jgi:hypothetical protein
MLIAGKAMSQNYTRDAGMRIGDHFSLTYRQYLSNDQALEAYLFFGRQGISFGVLKEYFQPVIGHISDNLYFQYGYGAHLGYRYTDHYQILNRTYELDKYTFSPLIGVDGLVGIEYRFPEFPFLISMDIKPYFEFSTIQIFGLYLQSFGLSLKYKF